MIRVSAGKRSGCSAPESPARRAPSDAPRESRFAGGEDRDLAKKLYIGNLSFNTTEGDLRELMEQYGPTDSVAVIMDRETGRSRGFGFVEFSEASGADAAISALDGKDFDGRSQRDPMPAADIPIVAYDFGVKYNILRKLRQTGFAVTVVPADTPPAEALKHNPAGIFLSNGPGDPAAVTYAAEAVAALLKKGLPIFGICLGHQILSLAMGGKTSKLKFGHRGANQPVKDFESGRVEITSQNHGFTVETDSLPSDVAVNRINLNDQTVEGLRHKTKPVFCVQYHPEASPGPHDSSGMFGEFRQLIEKHG